MPLKPFACLVVSRSWPWPGACRNDHMSSWRTCLDSLTHLMEPTRRGSTARHSTCYMWRNL
jgi:hypothetical protein